jgi:KEOPS complex subunit Cgi121
MKLVEGRATVENVDAFLEELTTIGDAHGVIVQAFDARYVAGADHLGAAARSARRSRAHDDAIADDPAVELLLYAAGRRQIDQALTLGIQAGSSPVVVAIDGSEEDAAAAVITDHLEPAETLGTARDPAAIRRYFDINEAELAATDASLEALVIERVVRLAVEK